MMWLPAVITVGFLACVAIGMIRTPDIGMSWLTLVACVVFTLGITVAFAVTYFATPGPADWWQAPAGRVAWQIGGSALLALACVLEARRAGRLGLRRVWVLVVVVLAIGPLAASNPTRDLLQGPLPLRVVDFDVVKTHAGARGGSQIFGTLKVRAPGGLERTLDLAGWGASDAEAKLGACADPRGATVVVLEHLERVVDVRCR